MELVATFHVKEFMEALLLRDIHALMYVCRTFYRALSSNAEVAQKHARALQRIHRFTQAQSYFSPWRPTLYSYMTVASHRMTFQLNLLRHTVLPLLAPQDLVVIVYNPARSYAGELQSDMEYALKHLRRVASARQIHIVHYPHAGPDSNDALTRHQVKFPDGRRVMAICGDHNLADCSDGTCYQARVVLTREICPITNLLLYESVNVSKTPYMPTIMKGAMIVQKPIRRADYSVQQVALMVSQMRDLCRDNCTADDFEKHLGLVFDGDGLLFDDTPTVPQLLHVRRIDEFV